MFKVNKFFCFELDKGGRIIGWIAKISCIIVIAFAVIFLLIGLFMSCDHVGRILEKIPSETNLDCFTAKIAVGIFLIIIIAIYAYFYHIYNLLIRGINNRNHCQVRPALIWEIIAFIICIIALIFSRTIGLIIYYTVCSVLSFYCTIVLYSIYDYIKSGKSNPQVAQYSGP